MVFYDCLRRSGTNGFRIQASASLNSNNDPNYKKIQAIQSILKFNRQAW